MSLLLTDAALDRRKDAAAGPLLPLVASLRRDLEPLLATAPEIPSAKALLSRDGGRCPRDGAQLAFDPFSPSAHRCPSCGEAYTGDRHHRAWITWFQLWLIERAVHAAALNAVLPDERLAGLARGILGGYAARYLDYPNRDNVLGPSRPFFSTYLESIWLLYVSIAMDLLEQAGAAGSLSATVRERIIAPSLDLVASYDEGGSNRQVWNNAALIAASLMLDRTGDAERVVMGRWGVLTHLSTGLLADGSWFEGENYHLFAHRGLWYGVTLARRAGVQIPTNLARRFDEGYATPLATALPDFTFPSRRDSQYAVSLRQWRFAEACELGVVRTGDRRLLGALHELYERPYPRGDTGRWRSTAESERNEAPTSLSRADLGWRSLLFARPALPALEPVPPRSALLEWQGYAVFRRDGGQVYAALDYGHSGGGHGHPDRLNLVLCVGRDRWLDDMGTGAYVDPSLHWYRSTLAHNAPLIDGRSQQRAHGQLRAYDERGGAGWSDAELRSGALAPGVRVGRTLIVMTDYLVDRLVWESEREVRLELPIHAPGELQGASEWRASTVEGGSDSEDGFAFLRDAAIASPPSSGVTRLSIAGRSGGSSWFFTPPGSVWWRATAPGPPNAGEQTFHVIRSIARRGIITALWSWTDAVADVTLEGDVLRVLRGAGEMHTHARRGAEWQIELAVGAAHSTIVLGGIHRVPAVEVSPLQDPAELIQPIAIVRGASTPLDLPLGEEHYRPSESSWLEAGKPKARVSVSADESTLVIAVEVKKKPLAFRPSNAPDPALDNEHPDIHSDGVQLYLASPRWSAVAAWLAVPEAGSERVRVREIEGSRPGVPLVSSWREIRGGYVVTFRAPLQLFAPAPPFSIWLDVIVNEMSPERQRRRGQLVLSGARGEYIYLKGDRQSADRLIPFVVLHA